MTRKLKDILRCYASGMSIRSISAVFEISRNTVRGYVRQFQECGLTMEKLQSIPEHHLQEMFCSGIEHSKQPSARQKELEALLPEYAARVKRKGVTVKSLYEEYIKSHPGGYQRSAFGRYLQRYTLSTRAVGHVEHYAGDQMYIGYAGDKLEIVDAETGDVRIVDVFVAILPCSHYTYCEASWSQRKEDLIKSCENALHFFGGVPMAIVPDNLKSAVTRGDRNEPVINEDFSAFAEHYGCAVYPARVRHPKDKALVAIRRAAASRLSQFSLALQIADEFLPLRGAPGTIGLYLFIVDEVGITVVQVIMVHVNGVAVYLSAAEHEVVEYLTADEADEGGTAREEHFAIQIEVNASEHLQSVAERLHGVAEAQFARADVEPLDIVFGKQGTASASCLSGHGGIDAKSGLILLPVECGAVVCLFVAAACRHGDCGNGCCQHAYGVSDVLFHKLNHHNNKVSLLI